jgi:glutamine synthetase
MATQTPKDVLKFAKDNKVEAVDLKFCDLLGTWQHFTIPTSELGEELFEEGSGLDGSSIRGWQPINASDMLAIRIRRRPSSIRSWRTRRCRSPAASSIRSRRKSTAATRATSRRRPRRT